MAGTEEKNPRGREEGHAQEPGRRGKGRREPSSGLGCHVRGRRWWVRALRTSPRLARAASRALRSRSHVARESRTEKINMIRRNAPTRDQDLSCALSGLYGRAPTESMRHRQFCHAGQWQAARACQSTELSLHADAPRSVRSAPTTACQAYYFSSVVARSFQAHMRGCLPVLRPERSTLSHILSEG